MPPALPRSANVPSLTHKFCYRANIADLHRRLVNRKYRAQPARRVWIPKSDGSQRPLAILVLEDKIVQRAVAMLLEAIYEPYFHTFSHGFRRGHSAHGALSYLRDQCLRLGINWIIGLCRRICG